MKVTPIHRIQGPDLLSPVAGQAVVTEGVVTGHARRGFFIQDPDGDVNDPVSHGIFIYQRRDKPPIGSVVGVAGKAVDYTPYENARPTTQLEGRATQVLHEQGPEIVPVWLDANLLSLPHAELAAYLNNLEGMLVGVQAGSTFVAPSNAFGDYVVAPPGTSLTRTEHGGILIDPKAPDRWLPGFRVRDYDEAPTVNVGAELLAPVTGPLNFRVASYQMTAVSPVRVKPADVRLRPTRLRAEGPHVTVLTLNGFNLDPHVERAEYVNDPARDIDDDVGSGRFDALASAVVNDAATPDIVALQEIQDSDGAEITEVVNAHRTLDVLVGAVRRAGGPEYRWADVPPELGADGGQPGGNIRNAFLYRPDRVSLVGGSLRRLGDGTDVYEDSRKPLAARFRHRDSSDANSGQLEIINVHLASKRRQHGLFAPHRPGFDPRLELRVRQAELIANHVAALRAEGVDYYVTGDFNDFEFSDTLAALVGEHNANLVDNLPRAERFDYNHRGLSQALMHGVVARRQLAGRSAQYEILSGNALLGIRPGRTSGKPSDHGYVVARLELTR